MVSHTVWQLLFWVLAIAQGYQLEDPLAAHTDHAILMDEKGESAAAINSFRAAAKFTPDATTCANLGEN